MALTVHAGLIAFACSTAVATTAPPEHPSEDEAVEPEVAPQDVDDEPESDEPEPESDEPDESDEGEAEAESDEPDESDEAEPEPEPADAGTVFIDDGGARRPATPKVLQAVRLGSDALVLGGYIQPGFVAVADTDFNEDDQEGFDFANARLTGRGNKDVYEQLYVGFSFNFDVNQGNFGVRDVFGSIGWRDGLVNLDVGQMKQPFSLALLQSESRMQFALSPQIRRIAFGRDQGVRLSSEATIGRRSWVKGAFMMANGEGGFRARRNLDDKFQYTGRLEVGPLGEVDLDEPDFDKSKMKFVLAANAGHTESLGKGLGLTDVGSRETRVGGDLRLHWHGASLRAE